MPMFFMNAHLPASSKYIFIRYIVSTRRTLVAAPSRVTTTSTRIGRGVGQPRALKRAAGAVRARPDDG